MSTVTEKKKGLFKKKEKPKKTVKQEIISWILTLGSAVLIALAIRTLLFVPIRVKGESMQNTLMNGEIVLATKPAYLQGKINRRDIVICRYPDRGRTLFVKRMIALPGDTLELREGLVYVNGELVDETDLDMASQALLNLGPVTLGEDEYFVMGDNRGHSNDSRMVGPITRDMIVGHVKRFIYPLSKFMQPVE